jgi:hypothetical protein
VNQRLLGSTLKTPAEVVRWLGAVQAQEYAMARWAIGLRVPRTTDNTVGQACDEGQILRTHVLRPTWHFVVPEDIRWMLELTAPRIRSAMAYNDRQFSIDARLIRRAETVIEKALRDESPRTRVELKEILAKHRIIAEGPRLAHLLIHAELDALICSGPRRGKQATYALLEQRAPTASRRSRADALGELGRRYFASRGPATAHDFAWWSGLTVTDAHAAIEALGSEFIQETFAGRRFIWRDSPLPRSAASANFFLPDYDEYGIAYKDRTDFFAPTRATGAADRHVAFNRMIVLGGAMRGSWRRTDSSTGIAIDAAMFSPVTTEDRRVLAGAAKSLGKFFGKPVHVATRSVSKASAGESPVRILFGVTE